MGIMNKYLSQWLVFSIRKLHALDDFVTKNEGVRNPNNYEDLMPIDKADEDKKYSEAILWALKNKNVKNIAITGPYGSGKSSVLRTFEKEHKECKYLNISLGAFKDDLENTDTDTNRNSLIEKSVLQQMFYRVAESAIPNSRFQRIRDLNYFRYILKSTFVAIWLAIAGYAYKPKAEIFNSLIGKDAVDKQTYLLAAVVFTAVGLVLIINEIIQLLSRAKLNKINLVKGDIEFDEKRGDSILNKHLDEILYFFKRTEFDVVVIEDLDRFDEVDIFVKLRELNTLINNSDQIGRKIVFIYAIRDDVFKDVNRTKFFDFIVPIIPVINSSNSGEILLKKFSESAAGGGISPSFISDITLYIEDMRMLKNIYNEFILYKGKLSASSGIELPLDKLLGFIVYKNKYPEDFAKLNSEKGMVADVFLGKKTLVSKLTKAIEAEVVELQSELTQLNRERLVSIQELRRIYLFALLEKFTDLANFSINGARQNLSDILQDDNFAQLRAQQQIQYFYHDSYSNNRIRNSGMTFKAIEDEVNPGTSYAQREALITNKTNGRIEEIKKKVAELNEQVRDIKSHSMKELLDMLPPESQFDGEIKKESLLVYLIRNGYIDEMYYSFISYFYEGSITKNDMEFVLSVKNQEPLEFTHPLYKVDAVIKKLNRTDYKRSAALNFDLLDTLLQGDAHSDCLEVFATQLCNCQKRPLEFVDTYLAKRADASLLINLLCSRWNGFWQCIAHDADYPTDKIDRYLKIILLYVEVNNILNVNIESSLSRYISKKENFLALTSDIGKIAKLKNVLTKLKVKFVFLESTESNKELFDFICENSLYEINERMVELIVGFCNPAVIEDGVIRRSNYTTIFRSECKSLIKYINDNINEYVEKVLLKLESNFDESEETVIGLLNNEEITAENKTAILKKEKVILPNLSDIEDHELWDKVITASKIKATWENLLLYFGEKKILDEAMSNFLSRPENYAALTQIKLKESDQFPEELIKLISIQILLCPDLSDESYDNLVKCIPYWYSALPGIENVTNTKIGIMIRNGKLQLTEGNFNTLKEHANNQYALLVEKNIDAFLKGIDKYSLDEVGLQYLLKSKTISDVQKIALLKSIDAIIVNDEVELARTIYNFYLKQKPCPQIEIALQEILLKQNIPTIEKVKLFNTQVDHLDVSVIPNLLTLIGEPISGIASNQQPTLENNATYEVFASKLKETGILSSYKEEGKKTLRLYPKRVQ